MLGPSGVRSRPHPWWTPVRLLLAVAVVASVLAVLRSVPCASGDDAAWWDPPRDQARLCATDLPRDYVRLGLADGVLPLADAGGRYDASGLSAPVAVLSWTTAEVARTLRGGDLAGRDDESLETLAAQPQVRGEALTYTAIATLLQLLALWVVVAVVARHVRRREVDALLADGRPPSDPGVPGRLWWLAAPPVLVLGGLTDWSLVPVALAVVGFVAWRERRPLLAGVLCGLALATAGLAVAVLVALVALVLRTADRVATRTLATAFVTWVLVSTVAFVSTSGDSNAAITQALTAGPDPRSPWGLLASAGLDLEPGRVGLLAAGAWLVVLVGVVSLGQARRRIDPAALVVVSLVGLLTVSTTAVASQALWLLPFVVLAHRGPTAVRDIGLWQAAEVLAFLTGAWQAVGATVAVDGSDPLAVAGLLLRLAATWWIAWRVVVTAPRDVARPAVLPVS